MFCIFSNSQNEQLNLTVWILNIPVCNSQGHGMHGHGETVHIPFPFDEEDLKGGKLLCAYMLHLFMICQPCNEE